MYILRLNQGIHKGCDCIVAPDWTSDKDGLRNWLVKGISREGYREILSEAVDPTEEETAWRAVFFDLINRGMEPGEVEYIVSDKNEGFGINAPHSARDKVHRELWDVFRAPGAEPAQYRDSRMIGG